MVTIHHCCASIEGILRNCKRKKINFLSDDDGKLMSDKEARAELQRLQALGHKLIPSSKCDNFDPFEKGCLGHEIEEEAAQR